MAGALFFTTPAGEAPLAEAIKKTIEDIGNIHNTGNALFIITAGLDTCGVDAVTVLESAG